MPAPLTSAFSLSSRFDRACRHEGAIDIRFTVTSMARRQRSFRKTISALGRPASFHDCSDRRYDSFARVKRIGFSGRRTTGPCLSSSSIESSLRPPPDRFTSLCKVDCAPRPANRDDDIPTVRSPRMLVSRVRCAHDDGRKYLCRANRTGDAPHAANRPPTRVTPHDQELCVGPSRRRRRCCPPELKGGVGAEPDIERLPILAWSEAEAFGRQAPQVTRRAASLRKRNPSSIQPGCPRIAGAVASDSDDKTRHRHARASQGSLRWPRSMKVSSMR